MFISPEQLNDLRQILEAGIVCQLVLLFLINRPEPAKEDA